MRSARGVLWTFGARSRTTISSRARRRGLSSLYIAHSAAVEAVQHFCEDAAAGLVLTEVMGLQPSTQARPADVTVSEGGAESTRGSVLSFAPPQSPEQRPRRRQRDSGLHGNELPAGD